MKNIEWRSKVQTFSGAMMIPIILIVAAGLSIGLGSAFTNLDNVKLLRLDWLIKEGNFFYNFFYLISSTGFMIMRYLPVFFAIGISMGLSKREKGWGALAGFVMYLGMNYILGAFLTIKGLNAETTSIDALVKTGLNMVEAQKENALYGNVLGLFTYNMSIFGSLISAFVASYIHNKLWDKELTPALSFFSGVRLVQLVVVAASIPLGIILFYLWPIIGLSIQHLGKFIANSGLFGTFLFGALDRALLPLGLHHLIAFPIEYTPLSGTMVVDGIEYFGVRNIMTAQLADPESTGFITRNFTTGRVLMHFAGLPAAALAIYHSAKKVNRKKLLSLLIPVTLTTMLIGVTEPLEFTFVYTAPILYYLIHVPLTGLSYLFTEVFNVSIYGFAVWNMWPNLLQPEKVHAMALLFLLPLYFVVYYYGFKWGIRSFKCNVPGREDDMSTVRLYDKNDVPQLKEKQPISNSLGNLIEEIVNALGGKDNILNINNCATRLRVEVSDSSKIASKEKWDNDLEAHGIIIKNNGVQIIYGTKVQQIAQKIKIHLNME